MVRYPSDIATWFFQIFDQVCADWIGYSTHDNWFVFGCTSQTLSRWGCNSNQDLVILVYQLFTHGCNLVLVAFCIEEINVHFVFVITFFSQTILNSLVNQIKRRVADQLQDPNFSLFIATCCLVVFACCS